MSAKAPPKPKSVAVDLVERLAFDGPALRIDKDAGIIYGVKVIGKKSRNGHVSGAKSTEYSDTALRAAKDVYEGRSVMIDHPDRKNPGAERSVRDSIGILKDYRVESADGGFADLHYSRTHPMAAEIVEDVERKMGRFGLSHNAKGEGVVQNGVYVIESIPLVRSVDLVTKPATNSNLWESMDDEPGTVPFKQFLESLPNKADHARTIATLLEMDGMGEVPVADMPAGPDPDEMLRGGFQSAVMAIVDQAFSGGMDHSEASKRIKELFKAHGKLTAKEEPAMESTEALESLEQKVKALEAKDQRREACDTLCESIQFTPTKQQLAVLMEIASEPARKTAAEAFKAAAAKPAPAAPAAPGAHLKRPVSRAPGDVLESQGGNGHVKVVDRKTFLGRLLN